MNIRKLPMAAAAVALSCATAACAKPSVSGFAWKSSEGASLAFRQAESWEEGKEGDFSAELAANRYILERPYRAGEARCLELSVAAESAAGEAPVLSLALYSASDAARSLAAASFPLRAPHSRLVLPLPEGQPIGSLAVELRAPANAARAPRARLLGLADLPAFRGFALGEEGPRVSAGFSLSTRGGESLVSIEAPFDQRPGLALVLEYRGGKAGDRVAIESVGPGGGRSSFSILARQAGGRVVLGEEAFEEGTRSIAARLPPGLEPSAFFTEPLGERERELADLGRVLLSRPAKAGADYDLYRWELLPSVLVLDFADYAAQDRYLKRLAFFVEKAGYRGTLQRDEVIGPLHGWNAHDYRPEDLAAFFRTAAKQGFPLNAEERALRSILAERGLIRGSGAGIQPGEGALISISRESPAYLRRTFLVHESMHAIFFADPEYRAFVAAEWKAMEKEEQWFWRRYFQWMVYDTSSEYLMANEYQAYLLQQPLRKATEYFTKNLPANLLAPEVLAREPGLRQRVEDYMLEYGSRFERRAAVLESWLSRKYGIAAGRSSFIE